MPTNQAATPSGAEILSFNTLTQVQSDWSQSNSAEPSFIKNKPTIPDPLPTSTSADAGKALVVDSTGAPAWSSNTYNETVLFEPSSSVQYGNDLDLSESYKNFKYLMFMNEKGAISGLWDTSKYAGNNISILFPYVGNTDVETIWCKLTITSDTKLYYERNKDFRFYDSGSTTITANVTNWASKIGKIVGVCRIANN